MAPVEWYKLIKDPCPSYDGPQTVPNQKVMNNSAIQWRIKKIISQHSLNSNSLIHRLLKTRDIANLSKKGIHHIMYPIHHMMYPYPAYDVPLSIIWCTPIHHMLHPVHHMMEELKNIYCYIWFVFYVNLPNEMKLLLFNIFFFTTVPSLFLVGRLILSRLYCSMINAGLHPFNCEKSHVQLWTSMNRWFT